jgi:hypothetical protein
MTKYQWPREWVEALADSVEPSEIAFAINRLDAVGALRDIPKKREFWECERCGQRVENLNEFLPAGAKDVAHAEKDGECGKWIHYIEADEEER